MLKPRLFLAVLMICLPMINPAYAQSPSSIEQQLGSTISARISRDLARFNAARLGVRATERETRFFQVNNTFFGTLAGSPTQPAMKTHSSDSKPVSSTRLAAAILSLEASPAETTWPAATHSSDSRRADPTRMVGPIHSSET